MRRLTVLLTSVLLLIAAAFFTDTVSHRGRYHYELRDDLHLHFSNADAVIEAIRQGLRRRDDTITVTYSSRSNNMDELSEIVRELMQYAAAETDRPDEGDYILYQYGGYELKYSYRKEQDTYFYTLRILPALYTNRMQEEKVNEKIAALNAEWHFTAHTSDYDKIRTVYDYVSAQTEYDRIHQKNAHYHLKSTAYGTLINGHALCQGYAVTVYRLLRECGVNCRVITGTAVSPDGHTEAHAWNIVCLDGRYYALDVTWDDQQESETYFLCGTSDFPNHTPDAAFDTEAFHTAYPLAAERYSVNCCAEKGGQS